jgi:hypothetical protein
MYGISQLPRSNKESHIHNKAKLSLSLVCLTECVPGNYKRFGTLLPVYYVYDLYTGFHRIDN